MIREIIQTLACLSVLNGSTLSLHLTNDRSAEHSSSSGSPPMPNPGGTLQHHSNNPYRRMAAAAESERMLFMGGGRHGRPIITGRLHLTSGDPDGGGGGVGSDGGGDELNYQPSSLTMLQDNEFPIRREPFFFDEDDGGDGGGGVGGGGIGYGAYRHPSPDHYHHRYDDGSYEIMEDIFNRGEGIYRKFPPIHHQAAQYHEPAPRGLQELFEHHENVAAAADEISPNHRVDIRYKQKSQRKRTQQKQNPDKLSTNPDASSSGSGSSSSSSSGSVGKVEAASPAAAAASQPSSASAQEQQQNTNQQQQQQQLLHPNSNNKRSGIGSPPVTHSIASQLMLRSPRGQRQYDVPQIECPSAIDGMERFACPTPDRQGRYRCIDDHVLCDGFIDCPEGEDEDRRSCMFYKTTRAHLDVLADALLRWARGR